MADRPAPETGGIEITPAMIEGGVKILADEWGVIGEHAAEELAGAVFRAMLKCTKASKVSIIRPRDGEGP